MTGHFFSSPIKHQAPVYLLIAVSGFLVYFPITNTDIWWHLAGAREMLKTGNFLFHDPFTFTKSIIPWVNIHWLFQIISYIFFSTGGGWALIWFKIVLFSASIAIMYIAFSPKKGMRPALFIFPYLIFESRYLVLMRPIILTLFCMACMLYCLEKFMVSKKNRWLWLLFPIQIFWCNIQGLYILGIFISGVYALELLLKKAPYKSKTSNPDFIYILLPVSLYLSCLINPNTWRVILYPFKLFVRISPEHRNLFSANVSENYPLSLLFQTGDNRIAAVVIITAAAGAVLFITQRKTARLRHILLFVAFFILAVMAKRNILLFFFITSPILCRYLSEWMSNYKWERKISIAAMALILCFTGISHGNIIRHYPKGSPYSPFRYPVNAVEYLRQYPVEGNIFNSIRYGGYLIWTLFPPKKTYIDGRLVIRRPEFFAEYLSVLDNPQQFHLLSGINDITHVIIPTAIFERYFRLAKWLYNSPKWGLAYSDGVSVLFINKRIPGHNFLDFSNKSSVESVLKIIDEQWRKDPSIRYESRKYFCNFLDYLGETSRVAEIRDACKQ